MANARDTGGNVAVDFVWGNMPLQPDDDRGADVLDPTLDNHNIADVGWSGYPAFLANDDNDVPNVVIPSFLGKTAAEATAMLGTYGLVAGTDTVSTTGAVLANDLTVKSQTPVGGTVVDEGEAVDLVFYNYIAAVPNVVGMTEAAATAALVAVGLTKGAVTTTATGANVGNDGTVKTQTPAAAATVDISEGSTDVDLLLYAV